MATNPLLIRGPKSILFRNQRVYHKRHLTEHFYHLRPRKSHYWFHCHSIFISYTFQGEPAGLSSLRTSESVESLNVRINTRLGICPFRSMNQFDQLHLKLLINRKWSIVLYSEQCAVRLIQSTWKRETVLLLRKSAGWNRNQSGTSISWIHTNMFPLSCLRLRTGKVLLPV